MGRFLTLVFLLAAVAAQGQEGFYRRLADSALTLTSYRVTYDPAYYTIPYPGGDLPRDRGVCTDVVVRAYRKVGIDLQREVHEDMKAHFDLYPRNWGLRSTDRNIDHRRVPNLMTFFSRRGQVLEKSTRPEEYAPGDIVCWNLGGGVTHIGLVAARKSSAEHPLVIHNIGGGQVVEDCLFAHRIIGHYRYKK